MQGRSRPVNGAAAHASARPRVAGTVLANATSCCVAMQLPCADLDRNREWNEVMNFAVDAGELAPQSDLSDDLRDGCPVDAQRHAARGGIRR